MKTNLFKNLAVLLLLAGVFYTCTAEKTDDNTQNEECLCDLIECDFDLSALNEIREFCRSRWAVELRLKYGITDCPLEDPKIKALVAEHNVTFRMSFPGTSSTVLMQYFTLIGENCSSLCYVRATVRAFLMTGLFENHIRVFGRTTTQ